MAGYGMQGIRPLPGGGQSPQMPGKISTPQPGRYADPTRNNPTGTREWADQEKAAGRDFSTYTNLGDISGYRVERGFGRGTGAETGMDWHYKKDSSPGGGAKTAGASTSALTSAAGATSSAVGAGGTGGAGGVIAGGGGAKVVSPSSPAPLSMSGLGGGGGGFEGGGPGDMLSGPSRFRNGIGTRMLPRTSPALAGLAGY